jgi:hypothetical protein
MSRLASTLQRLHEDDRFDIAITSRSASVWTVELSRAGTLSMKATLESFAAVVAWLEARTKGHVA